MIHAFPEPDTYDAIVGPPAKVPPPRLTWRAVPELVDVGKPTEHTREVWEGSCKGQIHFRIIPKECLGRPGGTFELWTSGPWFGGTDRIGQFLELQGAVNRAKRMWRNNSCWPSGYPCGCND